MTGRTPRRVRPRGWMHFPSPFGNRGTASAPAQPEERYFSEQRLFSCRPFSVAVGLFSKSSHRAPQDRSTRGGDAGTSTAAHNRGFLTGQEPPRPLLSGGGDPFPSPLTLHQLHPFELEGDAVAAGEDVDRPAGLREQIEVQLQPHAAAPRSRPVRSVPQTPGRVGAGQHRGGGPGAPAPFPPGSAPLRAARTEPNRTEVTVQPLPGSRRKSRRVPLGPGSA